MKTPSRLRIAIAPLALIAAATLLPAAVVLAGKDDNAEARLLLQRGEILPLTDILEIAQRRVPGDVLEAELEREDSGWQYKIKLLTPTGQIRKVTLNARNGAVLKIKDD